MFQVLELRHFSLYIATNAALLSGPQASGLSAEEWQQHMMAALVCLCAARAPSCDRLLTVVKGGMEGCGGFRGGLLTLLRRLCKHSSIPVGLLSPAHVSVASVFLLVCLRVCTVRAMVPVAGGCGLQVALMHEWKGGMCGGVGVSHTPKPTHLLGPGRRGVDGMVVMVREGGYI